MNEVKTKTEKTTDGAPKRNPWRRLSKGGKIAVIVVGILAVLVAGSLQPLLPWLLAFAAGAMLYVVVEELIPEMSEGNHSNIGTIFFAVGFSIMMVLDTALG